MEKRRLLIAFAHPDDESFGLGGLIARYVAEGVDVYLICATNGDVGTIPPEMLNGYKSIAELRLAELDCASEKLGFKQVFKLGYKDSGMMGSETSRDPESLWYIWQNQPDTITQRVVEIIREVKPHVVITFDRYGGYGHPDHIAIQQAATKAFDLAGDASYAANGHPPYQPQKLYYNHIPKLMLRLLVTWMRLRRQDPTKFGRNQDIDLQAIIDHVEPIHTRVNIRQYYRAWDEASACHSSQGGGLSNGLSATVRQWLAPNQAFTRIFPKPPADRVDEQDLFAGVQMDG